jgi:hypothetical protein
MVLASSTAAASRGTPFPTLSPSVQLHLMTYSTVPPQADLPHSWIEELNAFRAEAANEGGSSVQTIRYLHAHFRRSIVGMEIPSV